MIYYFYGEDTYAAREAIGCLAQEKGAALRWLTREDLEAKPWREWAAQSAGLWGRELPVIKDPEQLPKALRETLMGEPVSNQVLWQRGKGKPPKSRQEAVHVRHFMPPSSNELAQWLQQEAKRRGGVIEIAAARELAQRCKGDRWRMYQELERLLLLHDSIGIDVVKKEILGEVSDDVFRVLEAVTKKNRAGAIQGVERLLAQGDGELYVLSMLAYQWRTLLSVRDGIEEGLDEQTIAREKRLHAFAVKKNMGTAKRVKRIQLLAGLTKILATDFAIKQGRVDARTGLMMLILELGR